MLVAFQDANSLSGSLYLRVEPIGLSLGRKTNDAYLDWPFQVSSRVT